MMETITVKDALAELYNRRLSLSAAEQGYRARVAEIEDTMNADARVQALRSDIAALEAEIKGQTISFGETVKGERLQAVFVKGRTSWDTKGLDVYAKTNPDVLVYRVQGDPSVQIREVKP